ncbi:hypothetical protein [Nitrosopumilus sp.]|uniref:hypothetical protein n=1 Tax=Nitrosopumilus sp. TaxID=2024843 RepID=UPI00247D7016|nr:hypothetical protein [Nitrosopumilus sp.]MCV0430091.1 hypothetical protein [Nitrosopumilus sp.]
MFSFNLDKNFKTCTVKFRISHHRGIANVVTSGILLASVSIIGVMLLGWSQTSISQQQQEMDEVFNTQMNKIREDLIFENIWFATPSGIMTANHLNVTIANVGILGLNVTSIQVTNVTGTNNTSFTYTYTDAGVVKSESLSLNATYPWQSSDELDVIVFTNRDNQFISQVVAP